FPETHQPQNSSPSSSSSSSLLLSSFHDLTRNTSLSTSPPGLNLLVDLTQYNPIELKPTPIYSHVMELRPNIKNKWQAHLAHTKPNYLTQEPKTITQEKIVLEWCRAIQDELNALLENQTWRLVP